MRFTILFILQQQYIGPFNVLATIICEIISIVQYNDKRHRNHTSLPPLVSKNLKYFTFVNDRS
jgi:hypothetical protein